MLMASSQQSSVVATTPSFSSTSVTPRTITINMPANLTPAGRPGGGGNHNKSVLAPRIIGTVGRPIMNIGAYRPPIQIPTPSSSSQNFVTLRHQVYLILNKYSMPILAFFL